MENIRKKYRTRIFCNHARELFTLISIYDTLIKTQYYSCDIRVKKILAISYSFNNIITPNDCIDVLSRL